MDIAIQIQRRQKEVHNVFEFFMRVRIENGECLPQMTFVADPCEFENREALFDHCKQTELVMSVTELQTCLAEHVFDEDEAIVVLYTHNELMDLIRDSTIIFLWTTIPDALRQTFATRNVLPITRKMKLWNRQ